MLLSMGKEHLYVWEKTAGHAPRGRGRRAPAGPLPERAHAPHRGQGGQDRADRRLRRPVPGGCGAAQRRQRRGRDHDRHPPHQHRGAPGGQAGGHPHHPPGHRGAKLAAAEAAGGADAPALPAPPGSSRPAGSSPPAARSASGLIQDTFTPVIVDKLAAYGIEVTEHCLPGDDRGAITAAALDFRRQGPGSDPLHRRHERGPGRPDPRRHQGHRGG